MVLAATFALNLFCGFFSCVYVNQYPTDDSGGLALNPDSTSTLFRRSSRSYNGTGKAATAITNDLHRVNGKPVAFTKAGALEGYVMKSIRQRNIYAFEGVPFGETTAGKNRFELPIPKAPWSGIREAKKPGPYCLQFNLLRPRIMGSENCLYLNVYTPQLSPEAPPLPVVVFIHGGSWYFGSGSEYGPSYMLENDVILVTINYRMGILGFLSTGDDVLPGNLGMKDQALALKWVHENIASFGGDPSRVTLAGHSSGAVSVHLHMISNVTRNYFSRAISISGSAFTPWAIMEKDRRTRVNQRLAKVTNCPFDGVNSKAYVDCLRRLDPSLLAGRILNVMDWAVLPLVPIGVVVEKEGPGAFLTELPEESYRAGRVAKIPWVSTRTSDEGHIITTILEAFGISGFLKAMWKGKADIFLDYKLISPDPKATTDAISDFYFKTRDPRKVKSSTVFGDIFTDRELVYGIHKGLQAHSEIAPTYGGLYAYKTKNSVAGIVGVNKDDYGVTHVDDLFTIFNMSLYTPGYRTRDPEFAVVTFLTNLITTFAEKGEPLYADMNGVEHKIWDPISDPRNITVLQIDKEVKMIPETDTDRLKFWETLGLKDSMPWIPFS